MDQYRPPRLFNKGGDLNKRWYIGYYYRHPETGKFELHQIWISNKFLTRKSRCECANQLIDVWSQKLRAGFNPYENECPGLVPLSEAINRIKDIKQTTTRKRTFFTYKSFAKTFLAWANRENLANSQIENFNTRLAQKFADYLKIEKKVSNRTHNNYIDGMKALFNELKRREYFINNPFSKISNGGTSQDDLMRQLGGELQSIDSISSTLVILIDVGNTTNLNTTVATSAPSDAFQLRQQLLSYSPYLSDTVLKTAIQNENVLPNEMIRDILVANPQAPKSESVMDQLNNRYNPMPDSLLAEIQKGVNIIGSMDSPESELSNHLRLKSELFNNLVKIYKRDTVNPSSSSDSLLILLQNDTTLSSKYQLAFEYLKRKDTNSVHTTLSSIAEHIVCHMDQKLVDPSFYRKCNKMTRQAPFPSSCS